jgi:hypothetical protein
MPANSLNNMTLPSITGSAAAGTEIAQTQYRRPVGDDGHAIALDREGIGFRWVFRDGLADTPHPGCVNHREDIARIDRDFALDSDFSAQMEEENPVGCREHIHFRQGFEPFEDTFSVGLILHVEGNVPDHAFGIRRHDVYGPEVGPLFGQQPGHFCEDTRFVEECEADGQAVVGIGTDVIGGHRLRPGGEWPCSRVYHSG